MQPILVNLNGKQFKMCFASEVEAEIKLMQRSYEANKKGREEDYNALLERVRALVKVVKLIHMLECENFYRGCVCLSCETRRAIAAVEMALKDENKSNKGIDI